jgi:hypothetical protein
VLDKDKYEKQQALIDHEKPGINAANHQLRWPSPNIVVNKTRCSIINSASVSILYDGTIRVDPVYSDKFLILNMMPLSISSVTRFVLGSPTGFLNLCTTTSTTRNV